jgi:hypothetical protein
MTKNLVQAMMDDRPAEWTSILDDLRIRITRDGDLASLKYDQIESPMGDPLVRQCRGMVVDVPARRAVAWPYDKFWNHGEHLADEIDWSTARVQEKLDGSLMILFRWSGAWQVASSGHPTAGGSFGSDQRTFREAFWGLARDQNVDLGALDPGTTYMVELCDLANRVVVRHARPRIVLHGARSLASGEELSPLALREDAASSGLELVREFSISSISDCLSAAEALDPVQQEGFVVVDSRFRRVKIKSPRYVALHHMRGEATPRRAIELWQTGEAGEILAHFPELSGVIAPIHDRLDGIARQAAIDYAENRARASRKDFARAIGDRPHATVLFRMLTIADPTAEDARAIMRRLSLAALIRMLGMDPGNLDDRATASPSGSAAGQGSLADERGDQR